MSRWLDKEKLLKTLGARGSKSINEYIEVEPLIAEIVVGDYDVEPINQFEELLTVNEIPEEVREWLEKTCLECEYRSDESSGQEESEVQEEPEIQEVQEEPEIQEVESEEVLETQEDDEQIVIVGDDSIMRIGDYCRLRHESRGIRWQVIGIHKDIVWLKRAENANEDINEVVTLDYLASEIEQYVEEDSLEKVEADLVELNASWTAALQELLNRANALIARFKNG